VDGERREYQHVAEAVVLGQPTLLDQLVIDPEALNVTGEMGSAVVPLAVAAQPPEV
jgi:hypothetical protein